MTQLDGRTYIVPIAEDVRERFRADLTELVAVIREKLPKLATVVASEVTLQPSPSDWGIVALWLNGDARAQAGIIAEILQATTRLFLHHHSWPTWVQMETRWEPDTRAYRVWLGCHPHGLRGMPVQFEDDPPEEEIPARLEELAKMAITLATPSVTTTPLVMPKWE